MIRGHVTVALHNPKNPANVGGTLRGAGCYGADLVVIGGKRKLCNYRNLATDPQKIWRHTPVITVEDLFEAMPLGAIPIAVDLLPAAESLVNFIHPERAFYVFGPEDGTLGPSIYTKCKHIVQVPTHFCMNLAATVNVILYDREAKRQRRESQ